MATLYPSFDFKPFTDECLLNGMSKFQCRTQLHEFFIYSTDVQIQVEEISTCFLDRYSNIVTHFVLSYSFAASSYTWNALKAFPQKNDLIIHLQIIQLLSSTAGPTSLAQVEWVLSSIGNWIFQQELILIFYTCVPMKRHGKCGTFLLFDPIHFPKKRAMPNNGISVLNWGTFKAGLFFHHFSLNSRQSKLKKFSKLKDFSPKIRIFVLNSREIPNFPHENERIFC